MRIQRIPFRRMALGQPHEATQPDALKCAFAELISTLIFVYAGEGSGMAFAKLTDKGATSPAGLVAAALAHGLGLFVAVAISFNISGGHVNPAVTLGLTLGGHITVLRGILFWIAQLIGATLACLLLAFTTGGMSTSAFALGAGVGVWEAVVMEIVMTFALVYTVYATAVDPKRGTLGTIAPIAIGFIVGANILAGGAFTGGCMNPARAFGPALVSWTWKSHWVYWVGPLIGGALGGIIYDLFISSHDHPTHEPLPEY